MQPQNINQIQTYLILMSSFRKFWVFKNITNFTITVIGTAGIGLIYNSAVIERKFANNPIVNEAIKIVGLNDHVKDVIGIR